MKNKKAKGYSRSADIYVEGIIYHVYANGIDILTKQGLVFIENGEYHIIEPEE